MQTQDHIVGDISSNPINGTQQHTVFSILRFIIVSPCQIRGHLVVYRYTMAETTLILCTKQTESGLNFSSINKAIATVNVHMRARPKINAGVQPCNECSSAQEFVVLTHSYEALA